ncbi:MAG: KAP family NTPase [Planctomycetaceae bacterium]|jgi:predicted KAP-like P-loop ATPase|nr:KAP family NTPase [Planctomycetaceae bacterium]
MKKQKCTFCVDVPIEGPQDDLLDRAEFAKYFADSILNMNNEESFVFGICGEWGSGKSSLLNMIENNMITYLNDESNKENYEDIPMERISYYNIIFYLKKITRLLFSKVKSIKNEIPRNSPIIFRFNPWWFSGREQLLPMFFDQLSIAIGRNDNGKQMTKAGQLIIKYARVLGLFGYIPGMRLLKDASNALTEMGEILDKEGRCLSADVNKLRADIVDILRQEKRHIIIIMDDLDRMTAKEMTDLFQILKSIADFPYITYILGYDSKILAQSISNELGIVGEEYVKKIINIPFDLPPISDSEKRDILKKELEKINKDDEWYEQLFSLSIMPEILSLLKNLRDIKKIVNHFYLSITNVKNEIYPIDMFILSVLYVVVPEVYRTIAHNKKRFTRPDVLGLPSEHDLQSKEYTDFHKQWIDAIEISKRQSISNIVATIFPESHIIGSSANISHDTLRNQLRVADPECFDIYFRYYIRDNFFSNEEWNSFRQNIDNNEITKLKINGFITNKMTEKFLDRIDNFFGDSQTSLDSMKQVLKVLLDNEDSLISTNEGFSMWCYRGIEKGIKKSWVAAFDSDVTGRRKSIENFISYIVEEQGTGIGTISIFVRQIKKAIDNGFIDTQKDLVSFDELQIPLNFSREIVAIIDKRIEQIAFDKSLLQRSDFLSIIDKWIGISDNGKAKKWLKQQVEQDPILFSKIVEKVCTVKRSSGDCRKVYYEFSHESLSYFFDDDVILKISSSLLTNEEIQLNTEYKKLLEQIVGFYK